ncbi:uncharacterized protein LOC143368780 [Andrena cerasifolii]|uniref:uncharacterized protein LOC143368780 n=1 Tax=Andrena cerasifolii TaxID=2819439 RepID=UPI0040377D6C
MNESAYSIDYELLAIFDDVSALSHLEDVSLDPSIFDFTSVEESRSSTINDHRREAKKADDRQVYARIDQAEKKDVFAVPKAYSCIYCLKRFYSRSASRKHQVCHAKKQLSCPYCKARSHSISAVRRHFEYFHVGARRHQILIETQ